ncbi:MFS transporter [Nonomuraea glycinis]|uniref:MFS transporter n=1 Tax=Nonomuraea glycinis TaxID=2047744 RepID=A0A918E6M6_9ACTN|nr:MFS transporter [Nonomuraea glycinis]MCA2180032.1 MFS transporter [Nonomuraea glycinis]GGP10740.1 MFS transporter [Nonomuraea glycinis]
MAFGDFVKRHLVDTRPLSVPAYRRLWAGQAVSHLGLAVTFVAVSQQVYELTGSSFWVGMLGLANLIPLVVFGLWGGAVADAVDRRKLLVAGSLVAWASTVLILLQALLGAPNVYALLGTVALGAAGFAVSSSTRGAIIPRLLPPELVPSANALNSLVYSLGAIGGPMLGGVVLVHGGFAAAYAVDAVLFSAGLYAALRLPALAPLGAVSRPGWRSVAEGLRFILTTPVLVMSFVVDIIAMVFALPRALFPELIDLRFGGSLYALSWLVASMAVGAVVGGLFSGWVTRVKRQGLALTFVIAVWGLAVAAAGLSQQLWLVLLFMAVGGAADVVSSVWRQSILQLYAPDEMRGRMQGVFMVVVAGGPRLGDVRAGATASMFGLTTAWVGGGLACAVVVLIVGLSVAAFRTYRAR